MLVLRPIYTVQLCLMQYAYDKSTCVCTTQVASCKSSLQLACDCHVRHEECGGVLKHVLKPYDNRNHRQFYIVEIVYRTFRQPEWLSSSESKMMKTTQVVKTSVTITNSSFQNYTHPDDHTRQTTSTPGFKPCTKL